MRTTIERVCLHRNGALVVRVGEAGPGPVEVVDLPLLHAGDTLRIRPAAGTVGAVRETCRLLPRGDAAPVAPDDHAAQTRAARLAEIEVELAEIEQRAALLAPAADGPLDPSPPPDIDALTAWHDLLDARHDALAARRRALFAERRALTAAAAEAERTREGDTAPPRFTRGVAFTLHGVEAPVRIEVEYFVAAARWVPTYALELDGDRARLRFDALVAQASGEDWSGAEIAVSTADLRRQATAPALGSWRIGPVVPPRRPAFRPLPEGLDALFADYDRHRPAPPPPPSRPRPAKPRPAPAAPKLADYDGEMARSSLPPPPMAPPSLGAAPQGFGGAPPGGFMPPPAPSMAPMPDMPMRARAGAPSAKGGEGGGGAPPPPMLEGGGARPPDDGLPERLRYAYTRLAGPDEPGRGRLWPVDATAHLRTLVADHDPDAADALPRAVAALEAAAARLANAPTPPGTEPLPPDGYPVVRDATGAHDVPGDGRWHRVPVVTRTAAAAVDFRAVPRESNDVWRFCTVHLDDGEPLPQGPLRIHVDGRYRATGRLRGTGGGEPIEMNLGLEPALRIIDRKVEMMQEDRGLMTQSTRVEHRVITKIRSALDHPARLVVYDRLPVRDDPDDDRVAVEPLDTRPPAERTDRAPDGAPLDGGLRWRLDIPARGVVTVEHGYRITFPAKLELSGGNRRE
ncbi:MAG: DUF4139 domain-containing protein [Myxococcales bacterium]|nr:DUF4139 domain-containing protein [Myxococcales bacterium]